MVLIFKHIGNRLHVQTHARTNRPPPSHAQSPSSFNGPLASLDLLLEAQLLLSPESARLRCNGIDNFFFSLFCNKGESEGGEGCGEFRSPGEIASILFLGIPFLHRVYHCPVERETYIYYYLSFSIRNHCSKKISSYAEQRGEVRGCTRTDVYDRPRRSIGQLKGIRNAARLSQ